MAYLWFLSSFVFLMVFILTWIHKRRRTHSYSGNPSRLLTELQKNRILSNTCCKLANDWQMVYHWYSLKLYVQPKEKQINYGNLIISVSKFFYSSDHLQCSQSQLLKAGNWPNLDRFLIFQLEQSYIHMAHWIQD